MKVKAYYQNTREPKGILGKLMLKRMNRHHTPLSEWALSLIDLPKGGRYLDAGCGGGLNMKRLLDSDPKGYVCGLDYSRESVAMSRKVCADYTGRFQADWGDVHSMPYGDGEFDLVTAFETVFFWTEPVKSFGEARRVLKDGGRFMVVCEMSDPTDTTMTDIIDGLNILTAEDISGFMKDAGFSSVDVTKGEGEWICVIGTR